MTLRSSWDKGIRDFLSGEGRAGRIIVLITVGLALILLAGLIPSVGAEQPSGEEERLCQVLESMDGVGECVVMLTYESDGGVYAAAVLCEGAESVSVRQGVISVITSLYGIGSNRVEVCPMSSDTK